jgi:hypothetical protein
MSEATQARATRRAPETEISVDLAEGDPSKAVARRAKPQGDIAAGVRDNAEGGDRKYSDSDREMFKRMTRYQKNITREFNQKLADQEARHKQEMSELRTRYEAISVERGGDQEAAGAHEKAMKALEEQLAAANEKGDSQAAARITAEMIRTDGAYHARLSGTKQRADTGGGAQQQQPARQEQRPAPQGPTGAGARFINANDWWDDPEFTAEKAAAGAIFLQLRDEEGYDANSDATFREVAERLKEKFPKMAKMIQTAGKRRAADPDAGPGDDDGDEEEDLQRGERQESRRRAPAGNMQDRGANSGHRNNGNRRTLTSEEIKTMRAVNLNPDNDRDVVQFLREAVALDAAGA